MNPSIESTISLIYLGIVSTGLAWLLRFRILKNNGLIFQSQVSYLIPIFGMILGYIFLKEMITTKDYNFINCGAYRSLFCKKSRFYKGHKWKMKIKT